MLLNRTLAAEAFVFGSRRRATCALCGCEGEDWDRWAAGHRWVRVAASAYSGDEERPGKPGQFVVVELCRDCAIHMGRALAPMVEELEQDQEAARAAWRMRKAEQETEQAEERRVAGD